MGSTNGDIIHFGDGDPAHFPNALPFSAAYDVVAHELAHRVTAHTSNLKYENESGALNEAFSDIMGSSAEHAAHPDDAKSFLIGEDLFIPGLPGLTALRSMSDPHLFGNVDHYEDRVQCQPGEAPDQDKNDECGVHNNSGIANRAFSLIVAGGSLTKIVKDQPPVTRPIAVSEGIGWDKATEISYWAFTGLTSTATFANAALAEQAEAARIDVSAFITVSCAWAAVGVLTDPATQLLAASECVLPQLPPPTPQPLNLCSGHGDNYVCDSTAPEEAIKCQGGAPTKETVTCADGTLHCKTTSADDPTAVLDGDGIIVCE